MPMRRLLTLGAYVLMCAIWGTTWLAIRVSLHSLPPIFGAGIRFIVAGIALYSVAMFRPRSSDAFPWKLVLVLAAFLFGLNYLLTYYSETRLDSGLVSVLFGTLPFFVFAFAALAHEKTTPRIWIGTTIGFLGVGVISLTSQIQASPLAALAVIGAAASSAFANVYAKRHSHHDPLRTLPPAMLIAGVIMTIEGIPTEHPSLHDALAPSSIASVLYLALAGSGIAFFLNFWLLQRIEVWKVGLSSLIIPVIAVVVGIVFGGEQGSLREFLGGALVIAGMWLALSPRPQIE